jgi:hypothetical protein
MEHTHATEPAHNVASDVRSMLREAERTMQAMISVSRWLELNPALTPQDRVAMIARLDVATHRLREQRDNLAALLAERGASS